MDSYVVKVQKEGTIRRLTLTFGEKQFSYEQLQSRIGNLFQLPASAQFVLTYTDKDGDVVTMAEDEDLKDALVLQKLNPLRVRIENLQFGTDDVKVSSPSEQKESKSDGVTEQQQQSVQAEQISQTFSEPLKVDPVANVEPDGKVATTTDGVADSNPADASSQASAAAVDAANKIPPEGATATGSRFSIRLEAKRNDGGVQIHSGVKCDGCGMLPIRGPRFKSCKKPNYDLCLKCFEASGAEEDEYVKVDRLFYRIGYPAYEGRMRELQRAEERTCRKPDQSQNSTPISDVKDSTSAALPAEAGDKTAAEEKSTGVLHEGVQCDECGMVPIQGSRYKSTTRFDYDVCHGCFEKSGSNASEYTCIEKPHYIARGRPLGTCGPLRRGPPGLRQCPGRWVWVMNRMVPGLAVDEAGAGDKTPAAGIDVKVGGDAEASAVATENSSTSAPTVETGPAPLFAKPADETTEAQTAIDLEKSATSTESDVLNNAGKTAGVEEEIAQAPTVAADETVVGVDEDTIQASAVAADGKAAEVEEETAQAPAVVADGKAAGVEEETAQAPAVATDGDLSTKEGLLGKLAAMGFEDPKLNEELLGKNNFDLRRTLDDLCAAEEWDPILGELQEMGFYDANMNRRLMFKNNGSVKRVVKELVQMYKGEKLA